MNGFPAGNAKDNATSAIARNWARTDVTQASAWLLQLPAGTSKDGAIIAFSNQAYEDDPQAAYQWALSVGDPNKRQGEVYSLLSRWIRSDPTTAGAIVQQSGLSDDQKNQLLQRANR
jgi:hypothetical protein